MNVVCTGDGDFVEVQGTGEDGVFRRDQLDALLDLGRARLRRAGRRQQKALAS
jgi:ribonuclease PH